MTDKGRTYKVRLMDGTLETIGNVAHVQMTMLGEISFWQDYTGTCTTYRIRDINSFSVVAPDPKQDVCPECGGEWLHKEGCSHELDFWDEWIRDPFDEDWYD